MSSHIFDSTRGAITYLAATLGINDSYLAGFLGVSEKSLHSWKPLGTGDLTPKAKRLKRLFEVVSYLESEFPNIPKSKYKSFLESARITIDPNDEDDGSVVLITFIIEEPETKAWVGVVREAVENHFGEEYMTTKEPRREATASIRHP
jgi:hypothetical protein